METLGRMLAVLVVAALLPLLGVVATVLFLVGALIWIGRFVLGGPGRVSALMLLVGAATSIGPGSAAAEDALALQVGASTYRPALGDLREVMQDFEDEQGSSLWVAARVPTPGRKGQWTEASWSRYAGQDRRGVMNLRVDAVGLSWLLGPGRGRAWPVLGVGADALLMRRDLGLGSTTNDWLTGLHGLAGAGYRVAPWLAVEMRAVYRWSRQSTFGGFEYDLGDAFWTAGLVLML